MQTNAAWARWVRVGLATGMLGVQLDGCASNGYPPRSISEPNAPLDVGADQPDLQISRVREGTKIRIALRDSTLVDGEFRGIERMGDSAYRGRVESFRRTLADSLAWPLPGQPVVVRDRRGKERSAALEGFGFGGLEVRWNSRGKPEFAQFADFESVSDALGNQWSADSLAILATHGRLPTALQIEVETLLGMQSIPIDRVLKIQVQTNTGEYVAAVLVVGLLAVVVLLVIAASQKPTGPSCDAQPTYGWERQLSAQFPELRR